jgi:hypothetical protein
MQFVQTAITCLGFSLANSSLPYLASVPFSKKSEAPNAIQLTPPEIKFLNNFLASDLNIDKSREEFVNGKLKLTPEVQEYVDKYLKDFCGVDLKDHKDLNAKYILSAFYMISEAIEVKLT